MADYKQLCAEGVAFIWFATDHDDLSIKAHEWAEKANAALEEPEPEKPTDRELLAALKEAIIAFPPDHPATQELSCVEYMTQLELRKARAIFATWGSPAPQPIPVTERLPGPEDCVVISWSELRSPHVWAGKRRLINGPTEIWDWTFASIPTLEESGEFTHWLPASASVLPAGAIRQFNPSAQP